MSTTFLLLLMLSSPAEAGPKQKRSGASRQDSPAFVACVEDSVLGSKEQACEGKGNSDACVGLRRALELSRKKTTCLRPRGPDCEEWGHDGRTQSEWVSLAAAHLADFGSCVRKQYGSEESSGLAEALADESLITLLKKLDDGSKFYRMGESAVLIRTLHGDRFSRILERSPLAKEIKPADFFALKDAADTPAVFDPEIVNAGSGAGSGAGGGGGGGEGKSPAQMGENFSEIFSAYLAEGSAASMAQVNGPISQGPSIVGQPAAAITARTLASTFKSLPSSPKGRRLNNPYSLGLDRTLFERVTDAYQRRGSELRGTDEYIRSFKPAPPRDLGELLSRGGTL